MPSPPSSSTIRRAFGERVRDLRIARGLSQEAAADLAGIHRTYWSSVEQGHRNVGLDNIGKIATALQVRIGQLF